jgi:hypothetical protein
MQVGHRWMGRPKQLGKVFGLKALFMETKKYGATQLCEWASARLMDSKTEQSKALSFCSFYAQGVQDRSQLAQRILKNS